MKEKRINKYYKTCCHSSIEIATTFKNEDGSKNPYYFYDALLQYKTFQDKTIDDINGVESDIKKRLKEENTNFNILFTNVLKLYSYVCKYKSIRINENKPTTWIYLTESAVEQNFSLLNFHRSFINELVNNDRVKEAIQVKRFLLENFKGLLNHFENSIRIRLEESPLAEKVLSYQKQLKSAISFDEIEYFNSSENDKKKQKYTGNELALAYIFNLFSQGKQIPVNQIEGGYSKKKIEEDCKKFENYVKPNTVYNAIRKFKKDEIDFNSTQHLKNISLRWSDVVLEFASEPKELKKYLEENQLIKV